MRFGPDCVIHFAAGVVGFSFYGLVLGSEAETERPCGPFRHRSCCCRQCHCCGRATSLGDVTAEVRERGREREREREKERERESCAQSGNSRSHHHLCEPRQMTSMAHCDKRQI